MADRKAVKKFLAKHPHFELFRDDQNREKVRCKLTGHELLPRLLDLENYIKGKKYQRVIKEVPDKSPGYEEYKEFLVPSQKPKRNQLYCQLTKKYINNAPHHIQRHVTGKRFTKALEKHREQQKLEAEHADEDMWVPSDLESDSEHEEEEVGEKKEEEDDGDSGGEFSSEDEEDTYEMKEQDGLKRTLKDTNKSKPTKKIKASSGTKLVKEKDIKRPKKTKTKMTNKS
ncbi:Surfeit locus protein 2 [Desmophyllum pertusum]|uniref:Surfeit locus protein 2 n=1 Tax=Desmophyllum pertusum TaxID=174260 RepID=A0A9W9YFF7_9CNID|nr:Surfeit locus protein 2 [Desmophyllum pertusum]